MFKFSLIVMGTLALTAPAVAQPSSAARLAQFAPGYPARTGSITGITENNTGGDLEVVISRGPTGADTITNNSAAGGNEVHPERAIPDGSAGGGGR